MPASARRAVAAQGPRAAEVVRLVEAVETRLAGWYDDVDLVAAAVAGVRAAPGPASGVGPVVAYLPERVGAAEHALLDALAEVVPVTVVVGSTGDPVADRPGRELARRLGGDGGDPGFATGVAHGTRVVVAPTADAEVLLAARHLMARQRGRRAPRAPGAGARRLGPLPEAPARHAVAGRRPVPRAGHQAALGHRGRPHPAGGPGPGRPPVAARRRGPLARHGAPAGPPGPPDPGARVGRRVGGRRRGGRAGRVARTGWRPMRRGCGHTMPPSPAAGDGRPGPPAPRGGPVRRPVGVRGAAGRPPAARRRARGPGGRGGPVASCATCSGTPPARRAGRRGRWRRSTPCARRSRAWRSSGTGAPRRPTSVPPSPWSSRPPRRRPRASATACSSGGWATWWASTSTSSGWWAWWTAGSRPRRRTTSCSPTGCGRPGAARCRCAGRRRPRPGAPTWRRWRRPPSGCSPAPPATSARAGRCGRRGCSWTRWAGWPARTGGCSRATFPAPAATRPSRPTPRRWRRRPGSRCPWTTGTCARWRRGWAPAAGWRRTSSPGPTRCWRRGWSSAGSGAAPCSPASTAGWTAPAPRPASGVQAPTRLESYAACPRRYLFETVLRVEVREPPEALLRISPVDRGSIVHRVLERFVAAAVEGPPVDPGTPWGEAGDERLRSIAGEVLDDYERRGLTGRPPLWRVDRAAILGRAPPLPAGGQPVPPGGRRRPAGRGAGLRPGGEPGVTVPVGGGRQVAFRGTVDRVDRTAGGGLSVLDYKTGPAPGWPWRTRWPAGPGCSSRSTRWPPRERYRPAGPVEVGYWFVSDRGSDRGRFPRDGLHGHRGDRAAAGRGGGHAGGRRRGGAVPREPGGLRPLPVPTRSARRTAGRPGSASGRTRGSPPTWRWPSRHDRAPRGPGGPGGHRLRAGATLFVEAGAGSGKTTQLVARLLAILVGRRAADRPGGGHHVHRGRGRRAPRPARRGAGGGGVLARPGRARPRPRPTRWTGWTARRSPPSTASPVACWPSTRSPPASRRPSRCWTRSARRWTLATGGR